MRPTESVSHHTNGEVGMKCRKVPFGLTDNGKEKEKGLILTFSLPLMMDSMSSHTK